MTRSSSGKLEVYRPQLVGLLVLVISATLSDERCLHHVPPSIRSHAAVFIGRISHALSDVIDNGSLLAYLSQCNGLSFVSTEENKEIAFANANEANDSSENEQSVIERSAHPDGDQLGSENGSHYKPWRALLENRQPETQLEMMKSLKLIFSAIKNLWQLIKLGYLCEALNELRNCKEELKIIRSDLVDFICSSAFALEYIRVVKLLAKLWARVLAPRMRFRGMEEFDLLLGKLDKRLLILRYRYKGLSKEEKLHVVELVLQCCACC